jgi:hypothetical protein
MQQRITCSSSAENAYQVCKQGFPDPKFELMHEVYDQHDEQIEAEGSELLRKGVLKDCGQYSMKVRQ